MWVIINQFKVLILEVEDALVEVKGHEKSAVIRNTDNIYGKMFEWPSWCNDTKEPTWCEYLMWDSAKDSWYPMTLKYKYYNDPENDAEVERRMEYGKGE